MAERGETNHGDRNHDGHAPAAGPEDNAGSCRPVAQLHAQHNAREDNTKGGLGGLVKGQESNTDLAMLAV